MSVTTERWTVMKLLQTSAQYLAEKGSPSSRLDAELLLGHTLNLPRIKLYTEFDKPVMDGERDAYRALIKRRAAGEPVAYILGEKEFYGRRFQVDKRVLVPRPETELIADFVRRRFAKDKPWRIADFGVGSGALAITLALEFPASTVAGIEVSPDALAVARENAAVLGAANVELVEGSWVEPVQGQTFDWVVSNPPYIADGDPEVEDAVQAFEPHGALFAGKEGLDAYEVLARDLPAVMAPGGLWVSEFGARQQKAIGELLTRAGWRNVLFENDLAGLPRLFAAERP
jgi:release factor glutamine methyltransferase